MADSSTPHLADELQDPGVSDHSCRTTQQKTEIGTKCMDDSVSPETEPVAPVVPLHPKSYMEIMEMIQRGERPDGIQDVKDDPPNPDQPIWESRIAPKPKELQTTFDAEFRVSSWEKQGQERSSLDLKSQSSNSSYSRSKVQNDSTSQVTGSSNKSNQGDLLLLVETVAGTEAPTEDAASSKQ